MTTADHAMEWWGTRGLEFWQTGGGCTAFGRNLDDGERWVMVTNENGDAPPVEGETVVVGLYDKGALSDGVYAEASTFDAALAELNALIEKHSNRGDA